MVMLKFNRAVCILNEIFDTTVRASWSKPKSDYDVYKSSFKAPNGRKYEIELIPTWLANLPDKAYQGFKGSDELFRRVFSDNGSYMLEFGDKEYGKDILDVGHSSAVFGIVINAVSNLVRKHKDIHALFFSAEEPSRRSLYKRMAPIIARKLEMN